MTRPTLTSTKAKRAEIIRQVDNVAAECGAAAWKDGRCDSGVVVAYGDYRAGIEFYPKQAAFVVAWYTTTASDAVYPSGFPGGVNPYHRRKATQVAYDVHGLMGAIRAGLEHLKEHGA